MHARAANAYRKVDLASAPKPQILERLFDRFLIDLEQARAAIVRKDIQTKANALDHAMRIVVELAASLDHAAAPALCANLAALYHFVTDRLTAANNTLAVEPIDQASRVMTELSGSFRQAHAR